MSDTALAWDCDRLQQALQQLLPGLAVQALAEVGSTNTVLLERLRAGLQTPCLLVAELQTQGRGRNGRGWQSAAGASLTFSLGLPGDRFAPTDWSGLSLAVGVALADAIEPWVEGQRPRLQIKWPNDLWLCDAPGRWRKLGGILIETVAGAGAGARACVVGVGLNVQPRADAQGLDSGYACVHELDATVSAPALLARVAAPLVTALQLFERDGLAPLLDRFARRDLLFGLAVQTSLATLPVGVADGVDSQGALRLLHAGGVATVSSGEVSVRPGSAPVSTGV